MKEDKIRKEKDLRTSNFKCVKVFKKDEIVGITTVGNKLIIATKKAIYTYPKNKV